jgi:hypothetical protein
MNKLRGNGNANAPEILPTAAARAGDTALEGAAVGFKPKESATNQPLPQRVPNASNVNSPALKPGANPESLNFVNAGPHYQAESHHLEQRGDIAITNRQPLLTREQATQQLGFSAPGALAAAIHLPNAKDTIYVFDRSTKDAEGNKESTMYTFMSTEQLAKLGEAYKTGEGFDEVYDGALSVHASPYDRSGSIRDIGRANWLPGRPSDTKMDRPHDTPEAYAGVANRQMRARIDEYGVLFLQDTSAYLSEKTGEISPMGDTATVEVSPNYAAPGDQYFTKPPEVPDHTVANLHYTGPAAP